MKQINIIFLFFFLLISCSKKEELPHKTIDILKNNNVNTGVTQLSSNMTDILISTWNIVKTWTLDDVKTLLLETKKIESEEIIIPKLQKDDIIISSDSSITKFVNDKVHFSQLNYTPSDLVFLKWDYIIDTKWKQTLRKEANQYLQELSYDFYQTFTVKLKVVSAYRSYNYQKWIKDRGCSNLFCAKPWYSEHQTGLAVDFFEASSQKEFLSKIDLKKYFIWLWDNAHKYWFNNSYQNGKEIDWYAIEPWHWRYLWVDFATELKENNMTYWKYYNKNWEK